MQSVKIMFFGLFILAVGGCAKGFDAAKLAGPAEPSCGFVQSSTGLRVSWKNNLPVRVYISSSWPARFVDVVKRAALVWNDSVNRDLIEVVEGSVSDGPSLDRKNGVYWLTSWSPKRPNEQAQTTLYYHDVIPYDGDIKVNAFNFKYYDAETDAETSSAGADSEYDLESLLVHEMGHLLGLLHFYEPPTVMYPYLYAFDHRVTVSATDLKAIQCEYQK
jgi:hypothetical protein